MFDKYVKLAQEKQSLTQNGIAKKIGITSASMSNFMTQKALPSEETILKVAALAGISPERALIDLNLWRAAKSPERLKVWKKISGLLVLTLFFVLISENANAATVDNNIYYATILLSLTLYLLFENKLFFLKGKKYEFALH